MSVTLLKSNFKSSLVTLLKARTESGDTCSVPRNESKAENELGRTFLMYEWCESLSLFDGLRPVDRCHSEQGYP